ncbi:MAG TPA: HD domain-containing phosphohydrolase [Noviherbaspirillum sp.]|uniref:HD-GYP domain-containing protein n=1 Tax=Noviherbaspirillum sp. TaxID=1926288 RepID=UPI002B460512|nr:HD domain-containing phosphohydrolase [Noviherbaspirillum sp.]HJV85606.1 HD domain-containing phosphohydrolase [Noviherbaspirillum sp.]
MPDDHLINSVNKHYLDKVMNLAEEADIKATEDIYDARGMKLVAKGARISRSLQERLIMRRLSKPFESSIAVDSGVDIDAVATEAQRIVDTLAPVRALLGLVETGPSPLQILSELKFGSAMSTMLTIIERGGQAALQHSVMVSLVSICLARKFGLGSQDQTVVALAGLLHDIGELYIDPEYLHSNRRLFPHEWRHVVVHPRIGQMLIEGLENYPAAVAQAVFEHHERFDGGGYPRQVSGTQISAPGQVISVAEMISGILTSKDKPLERAVMALKIIPGEHPRELVSTVSAAMHKEREESGADKGEAGMPSGEEKQRVQALYSHLDAVLQEEQKLQQSATLRSKKASQILSAALERTSCIQRAISSTGLDVCLEQAAGMFESRSTEILFETTVAVSEIEWRMRDLARDVALQASSLEAQEAETLQALITLLDGEH